MPKVSVLIPIFNAAGFLNGTIESVLSQSYTDFELLLINDGSTDASKSICELFGKKDNRVKLFNKVNGGVSSARNIGIERAKGTYIIHVDADDILMPDALENLINKALESRADIVIGDFIIRNGSNDTLMTNPLINSSQDFLKKIILSTVHSGLWNKLIKRECYNDLYFDETINYMEDKMILTEMLLNNPTIANLNLPVYIYIQHQSSITNKVSTKSLLSMENVILKIESLLMGNPEYKDGIISLKLKHKIMLLNNSKDRSQVTNKFREVNDLVFKTNFIAFHYKILLWLEFYNFTIAPKLFKRLKKWI